jgi:outer membrane receptor protein involved in Fe transport
MLIERIGNTTRIFINQGGLKAIEDLLKAVPELELVGAGRQRSLRIRNSQSSGVIVMLDGRIQNSALTSTGDLAFVPLASVASVEVVRGGNYETSGLAGSVNFITDISVSGSRIALLTERGSFGRELYKANLLTRSEPGFLAGIEFGSEFSRNDFSYEDPRGQTQVRENNDSRGRRVFAQAGFSNRKFDLKLKGRYFERRSGIPGPVFQYTPQASARDFEREAYLVARQALGTAVEININGGVLSRTITYNSPSTQTSFIPYATRFLESARDVRIEVNRAGAISLGSSVSIRQESLDGADFIRPDASFGHHSRGTITAGLGSQIAIPAIRRFSRSSSANFGIRAERVGDNTFWGPSIGSRLNFDIPGRPSLDLAFFRSQRLPGLTDLYWKEDVFATPNPELRPEKSAGYEIGFELQPIPRWQSSIRLGRFETRYDDIIVWRRWGGDKFKPINLSAATIDGWEASFAIRPFAGPLKATWSGSFLNPRNREENTVYFDKYLTFRPIGSQRAEIELKTGRVTASLSGRHIGKRYMTEENTKSLPSVDIFDISLEYSLGFRAFEAKLYIEILNVGDKEYSILERMPERPRELGARIEISRVWEEL